MFGRSYTYKVVPNSMEQLCWYYIQGFAVCEEYVCFEIEGRKEEDNSNVWDLH